MFSILEKQAPAKQNATSTIATLCGRLQSATLLEDRRAAILGLRSFAKTYPASVASGGLRSLISCLNKDIEDVDTTKVTLETLLMLFDPDENSPEASDDIALWLADEFTQRQENITALLDLLDGHDFFSRLYSLQLISAISLARPERTQECVYTAPLGVSRLVAVLEDKREAIRSDGLLVLTTLTSSSLDLQKLVAFENAFDRIFSIIDAEGALTQGGIIVEDCLSLLANLLRLNVSNQSYFRETGWVKKLSSLFNDAIRDQGSPEGVAEWAAAQRDKNMWGILAVLRLFLVRGSLGTQANQVSFWQNGIMTQILDIAFNDTFDNSIRAEALSTAADLIRSNRPLQEAFGQQEVHDLKAKPPPQVNGHLQQPPPPAAANVISALLDLVISPSSNYAFNVRLAASECLKAYFFGHTQIKQFFLKRAIEGHMSETAEADNILSVLLRDTAVFRSPDPYRQWFAAILLFHLLFEDPETKSLAAGVTEGNAEKGEEVVTCIQNLSSQLLLCEEKGADERISAGYLMVLSAWLYEDHDAVNDFLSEGSNLQSIVQLVLRHDQSQFLISALCAFFLGLVYEFSTKDSPITRETLHSVLTSRLGREQYVDKITRLREHPLVRDFEVLHQGSFGKTGTLPEVYFDKTFIDFLKDNFSRTMRAIDRAPGMEVPVVSNGVQKGISRELVDSLRAQVDSANQTIQKLESDVLTLERKLGQEQADHRKATQSASVEVSRIKSINEALQRNHEEDTRNQGAQYQRLQAELARDHETNMRALEADLQKAKTEGEANAHRLRTRNEAEVADMKATITRLRTELEKASKEHVQDLQTAHEDYTTKIATLEARLERAEDRAQDVEKRLASLQEDYQTKEEARQAAQTELDDMLMVMADLEEKRTEDKKRMKEHGIDVSDAEDDGGEDGGGSEDDVD